MYFRRLSVGSTIFIAFIIFTPRGFLSDIKPAIKRSDSGVNTASPITPNFSKRQKYGQLPFIFEANRGQVDENVKFMSRGPGYNLYLTPNEAVLTLRKNRSKTVARAGTTTLRMKLVGSNVRAAVTGRDLQAAKVNYFIGNDPRKWRTDVPTYAKVQYKKVYRGVDLAYYGSDGQLEYDFIVHPGADPRQIRLRFDGAKKIRVDQSGDLVLTTKGGEVTQHKPVVYQDIAGVRKEIAGHYLVLANREVGFQIGTYDASQPLVIDPVLSYSTYLGAEGTDVGYAITIDAAGNAYVTGETASINFPTLNAYQSIIGNGGQNGETDAFITKFTASGGLSYSTYLGGNISTGNVVIDAGRGIAVDGAGNAYVTGETYTNNFPTLNGYQLSNGGGNAPDAFVTKLTASGALSYSTYLGGNAEDFGRDIAIDSAGNFYVIGITGSNNFPTLRALQPSFGGVSRDAFISKFTPVGGLSYSTFLGGNNFDFGESIAVDLAGNAYVTGYTFSHNFPTLNAFQASHATDAVDAFIAKLTTEGELSYSTFIGGTGTEVAQGIATDSAGNAWITGYTFSLNFPTFNAYQVSHATDGGGADAFVTRLNATGGLSYSTYLGGNQTDQGFGIVTDSNSSAYVTGITSSTNFPTLNASQSNIGGGSDAFVTKLNASGGLSYSTYLGGNSIDSGHGIASDLFGNVFVTGKTSSVDFPTANAYQPNYRGNGDAFISKLITFHDDDSDGIDNEADNCPLNVNPDQADLDGDDVGDVCDSDPNDGPLGDRDRDGIPNSNDPNPTDGPMADHDNDGILNEIDVCPIDPDPNQADADGDGIGDACDVEVTVLHSFDGTAGAFPLAGLIQASDGMFYGTTSSGGAFNGGTIFRIDSSGTFTHLYSFDPLTGGGSKVSALVQAADGHFYGTTGNGGAFNAGTIFRASSSGQVSFLHSLSGSGEVPAPLIQGTDGFLYGTAPSDINSDDGLIYRLHDGVVTIVRSLNQRTTGGHPLAPLYQSEDGFFYGSTLWGGTDSPQGAIGGGTVFRMDAAGALTVLHVFPEESSPTTGTFPNGALVRGIDGALYGVTNEGGAKGAGTVFRLDSSDTVSILHSFDPARTGGFPVAGLIKGSDGFLYGTTPNENHDEGTAFRMAATGPLSLLHRFDDSTGWYPRAPLVQGTDGFFYGTTSEGGVNGAGVIFRISSPNTPSGSDIEIHLIDATTSTSPVTLSFSQVIRQGVTALYIRSFGPAPPAGFALGNPPHYYELTTTAEVEAPISVCINYSTVSYIDESQLGLFHFENGAWANRTSSLDTNANVICATVESLSPFAIFERLVPANRIISANKDSFVKSGTANTNEGANERLRIQSSGDNRTLVGFDLAGISTVGLQSATLILTIAENSNNWGSNGRLVDAHRLLNDWSEGNGRNDVMTGGGPGVRGSGEGVTWNCAKDANIANQSANCNSQWNGANYAAATAPGALHSNGLSGPVSWDVTADVLAGAPYGWIIRKREENENGQVRYCSREGAVLAGDAGLSPQLVLVYGTSTSAFRASDANYSSNDISIIDAMTRMDAMTNNLIGTLSVGTTPHAIALSPDGTRAYHANYGSNNVSVIDTFTNNVVATVPVGTNPRDLVINPPGTRVYVANYASTNLSVIDTATNRGHKHGKQ